MQYSVARGTAKPRLGPRQHCIRKVDALIKFAHNILLRRGCRQPSDPLTLPVAIWIVLATGVLRRRTLSAALEKDCCVPDRRQGQGGEEDTVTCGLEKTRRIGPSSQNIGFAIRASEDRRRRVVRNFPIKKTLALMTNGLVF